ncbi:MAG: hypothetical protein U9Q76_07715 [candidate division WOR-3 bacterium]|nr:hypothetical protein [candidate division WOR-3 bacterium]
MTILLEEVFKGWKTIEPVAFTVGLQTRTPLASDVVKRGLGKIQKDFPELTEAKFDEKEDEFVLMNPEPETEKQILFKIAGQKVFEYAWGTKVDFDFNSQMRKLFDNIQDGFELYPIDIKLIDFKFYAASDWNGQHYMAIFQALLNKTPFASLFEPKRILQDDLNIRAFLDEDRNRIGVIRITSNVVDAEVFQGKFKDDLLKAYVAIAQIRGIPSGLDTRVADVFVNHSKFVLDFIRDKFIPCIVLPLDEALTKLSVLSSKEVQENDI